MLPIERIGRNPGNQAGGLARSSQIVSFGGTLYCVNTPDKPYDPLASAAEQTRQVLRRIDERLAMAHSDRSRILLAQVMLSDIRYFAQMNEVWDAWVDQAHLPARCCWAADLGHPDLKIEIVIFAASAAGIAHDDSTPLQRVSSGLSS